MAIQDPPHILCEVHLHIPNKVACDLVHLQAPAVLSVAKYDPKSKRVMNAPQGYQKIKVHLGFAYKHDGCHKARLVAGGHLSPDPIDSIYSGVVSTRYLRLAIFLAKLNNMEVWGADIAIAYLEATTEENFYIVAGPDFEEV